MLVELTKLAFVLLLEHLHPSLNVLRGFAFRPIFFQRCDCLTAQELLGLAGRILFVCLALLGTPAFNGQVFSCSQAFPDFHYPAMQYLAQQLASEESRWYQLAHAWLWLESILPCQH